MEQYVLASPEKVWSKLGTASSLRSQILASIAMGLAHSLDGVFEFLDGSFCAYQYGMNSYRSSVLEAVSSLKSTGMVKEEGKALVPTPLGIRVSELYIDPASAKAILDGLRVRRSGMPALSYLTLVCHTPDMPKLYVKGKEAEQVMAYLEGNSDLLLYDLPDGGTFDYEMVLAEVKTALMLKDWIEEATEDQIVERFDIGSGDIHAYVESAKWLVHAAHELAKLMGYHEALAPLRNLLIRIESGVKEELLPLISLRGVGRVRARALYTAGYRTVEDLRRATPSDLGKLPQIGPETVKSIKEQVGGTVSKEEWAALGKRKGSKQLLIEYYGDGEDGGQD
jgi:helicase